jgi:transcriptional regulator with XRE-family HTH domain
MMKGAIMDGHSGPDPENSFAALFGTELARLRVAANLSQPDLGRMINYSGGHVSMVEIAKRLPSRDFTERCDEALETGGLLGRLWPFVSRSVFPTWFHSYVELEAEAAKIQTFECQNVPGLLQTEGYARALLEACWTHQVEELVAARLSRQAVLASSSAPLMWALIDESVIRRPIGGAATMREQLKRLVELASERRIVLQVVPYGAGAHACTDGSMTLLSFREGPDTVYTERPGSGQLIDRREEVARCQLRYDLTRAAALSPEASIRLIEEAMEEM